MNQHKGQDEMNPKVFVSHASEDKDRFVLTFAPKLRDQGVESWGDRGGVVWRGALRGHEPAGHGGFPPGLRGVVADAARRARGLEGRPGGFKGQMQLYGRWYGYGVLPVPSVGDNVTVILFRSDPV